MLIVFWTAPTPRTAGFFTAQLQLQTGEIVGEGYAGTEENAIYFAIKEAQVSERGKNLGNFEARLRDYPTVQA